MSYLLTQPVCVCQWRKWIRLVVKLPSTFPTSMNHLHLNQPPLIIQTSVWWLNKKTDNMDIQQQQTGHLTLTVFCPPQSTHSFKCLHSMSTVTESEKGQWNKRVKTELGVFGLLRLRVPVLIFICIIRILLFNYDITESPNVPMLNNSV